MIIVSVFTGIYYNMIIAWAMYYLGASFQGIAGELPWRGCNNEWNTPGQTAVAVVSINLRSISFVRLSSKAQMQSLEVKYFAPSYGSFIILFAYMRKVFTELVSAYF